MDNSDFEKNWAILEKLRESTSSWREVAKRTQIPLRSIFYWKKNKKFSKKTVHLLQSISKIRVRSEHGGRVSYSSGGNTIVYERWHPKEILIRLDKFKQKVGTWKEVAIQLDMHRESLSRCKKTGRMSRVTGLLLDRLLTQKGFRVDLQNLPKKST